MQSSDQKESNASGTHTVPSEPINPGQLAAIMRLARSLNTGSLAVPVSDANSNDDTNVSSDEAPQAESTAPAGAKVGSQKPTKRKKKRRKKTKKSDGKAVEVRWFSGSNPYYMGGRQNGITLTESEVQAVADAIGETTGLSSSVVGVQKDHPVSAVIRNTILARELQRLHVSINEGDWSSHCDILALGASARECAYVGEVKSYSNSGTSYRECRVIPYFGGVPTTVDDATRVKKIPALISRCRAREIPYLVGDANQSVSATPYAAVFAFDSVYGSPYIEPDVMANFVLHSTSGVGVSITHDFTLDCGTKYPGKNGDEYRWHVDVNGIIHAMAGSVAYHHGRPALTGAIHSTKADGGKVSVIWTSEKMAGPGMIRTTFVRVDGEHQPSPPEPIVVATPSFASNWSFLESVTWEPRTNTYTLKTEFGEFQLTPKQGEDIAREAACSPTQWNAKKFASRWSSIGSVELADTLGTRLRLLYQTTRNANNPHESTSQFIASANVKGVTVSNKSLLWHKASHFWLAWWTRILFVFTLVCMQVASLVSFLQWIWYQLRNNDWEEMTSGRHFGVVLVYLILILGPTAVMGAEQKDPEKVFYVEKAVDYFGSWFTAIKDQADDKYVKAATRQVSDTFATGKEYLTSKGFGFFSDDINVTLNHWRDSRTLPNKDLELPYSYGLPGIVSHSPLKEMHSGAKYRSNYTWSSWAPRYGNKTELWAIGYVFPRTPTVFASHAQNNLIATVNRALLKRPEFEADLETLNAIADQLLEGIELKPPSFEEWNAPGRFPERRRQEHIEALARSADDKMYKRKSFIKKEKATKDDPMSEHDPRAIQGATDEFNVRYGPMMYAFSNALAKLWDGDREFTIKHDGSTIIVRPYYVTKTDSYMISLKFTEANGRYRRPVYITVDGKRWDATQNGQLLGIKLAIYRKLGFELELVDSLERLLKTEGRLGMGDDAVFYNTDATVRSGDPDTSSGNTFINIVIHVYALLMEGCSEADVWALGDDNLIIAKSFYTTTDLFAETLATTGIVPVVNVSNDIADVEFCSQLFYPTSDGYTMGPKIGRFLSRAGWTLSNVTTAPRVKGRRRTPQAYHAMVYKATLEAIQPYVNHVPFVRKYVSVSLSTLYETHVASVVAKDVEQRMKHKWKSTHMAKCSEDTWAFVEERYGLTPRDELRFERQLKQLIMPALVGWEPIDRLVRRDA